jgi:hypothetical protein
MSGNQERTSAADTEPVEPTTDDDGELLVVDPEDYHEAQRLREIHEARREVQRTAREIDTYTTESEHSKQRGDLAMAVTAYIYELLPLIRQTDYDDELADTMPWNSLQDYAHRSGALPADKGRANYEVSMGVFGQANEFLAEVKPLIQEQENDTWEV